MNVMFIGLCEVLTEFDFHWFVLSFSLLISFVFLTIWFIFKNRFERTRRRPNIMVITAFFGLLLTTITTSLYDFVTASFPCWLYTILVALIVPFLGGTLISRLILFFYSSKFSEQMMQFSPSKLSNEENEESKSISTHPVAYRIRYLERLAISLRILFCNPNIQPSEHSLRNMHALKFMRSFGGTLTVISTLIFPFFIVSLVIVLTNEDLMFCSGCGLNDAMTYTVIICAALYLMIGSFIWLRVRNFKDSWGMLGETFYMMIYLFLSLISFLLTTFTPLPGSSFSFAYFVVIFLWFYLFEQSAWQVYLAMQMAAEEGDLQAETNGKIGVNKNRISRKKSKSKIDSVRVRSLQQFNSISTSASSLDIILEDLELNKDFEEHLKNEMGLESLYFIRDVQIWKKSFYDVTPTARKARAKRIFKTYVSYNGLYAVNLPHSIAQVISQKFLSSEPDDIPENIFDDALKELKSLLNGGAVVRFLFMKFNRVEGSIQVSPATHNVV